jgi:predicted dehydrogenase
MPKVNKQRALPCEARVALIGVGSIADRYVASLRQAPGFDVVSVCSRNLASSGHFASKHGLSAKTLEGILSDPEINYILNLTPSEEHAAITAACLRVGKSVYSEKPLAYTLSEADALIELADHRGLLLACAPATFLWPTLAAARRLVRDGRLGSVVGALSTLVYQGPEIFHPNPAHLYSASAGPLRDMGVYQITALMALLGPITRVSAFSSRSLTQRNVMVGPDAGEKFPVNSDTHFQAHLLHANGAISSMIVSFDGISAVFPQFNLFGREAGLSIENAHSPHGKISVKYTDGPEEVITADPEWQESDWAVGPISAWNACQTGQPIETNARRARGVLEVLIALENAAASCSVISITPSTAWS